MSSSSVSITAAESDERQQQQREPFLLRYPSHEEEEEDISGLPLSIKPPPTQPSQRLQSLDVFRGLTVALMIFVDAGTVFPSINHSPWFGLTLADFVMPLFLFIVGVSICLAFKRISSKSAATKKAILRTIKLFLIGVLLQGGYFQERYVNDLTYGVDVRKIRWMGMLQRISIGYFFAAMSEIWLVNNVVVHSSMAFVKRYYFQWMFAFVSCSIYMFLLYGLHVPNWKFEAPSTDLIGYGSGIQIVTCGVRGSLEPPCNAAGMIDRLLLGEHHLSLHPEYTRMKQCSANSPNYGPLLPNSPGWCLAPFEPEGILSSFMAAITCFIGLQFGHILVHFEGKMQRIVLWSKTSFAMLITGYALELLGIPFCKLLYTLSFMFVTAGAAGLALTIIFYIVDVKHCRKPFMMLEWMGMNTLFIFVSVSLFPTFIQGFYWGSPENNLVDGTESLLQAMLHSKNWGTLAFVIVEILFWGLVSGFLHMKGVYIKM